MYLGGYCWLRKGEGRAAVCIVDVTCIPDHGVGQQRIHAVRACEKNEHLLNGHKGLILLFIKFEYVAKAVSRKAACDSFLAHATTTDAAWRYLVRVLYYLVLR